jgi:hypothetical protein
MKLGPICNLDEFWGIFFICTGPLTLVVIFLRKVIDYRAWVLVVFLWAIHAFALYRFYVVQRGYGFLP